MRCVNFIATPALSSGSRPRRRSCNCTPSNRSQRARCRGLRSGWVPCRCTGRPSTKTCRRTASPTFSSPGRPPSGSTHVHGGVARRHGDSRAHRIRAQAGLVGRRHPPALLAAEPELHVRLPQVRHPLASAARPALSTMAVVVSSGTPRRRSRRNLASCRHQVAGIRTAGWQYWAAAVVQR